MFISKRKTSSLVSRFIFPLSCLFVTAMQITVSAKPETIEPGVIWRDTDGNVIQAHAGGILKEGNKYFWFGEDKTTGSLFQNVKCYSSFDLKRWKFESNAITRQETGDLRPNRIIERPKVLYNGATKKYVMYMHLDSPDYKDARVGVATSSRITGPYTYLKGFRPLGRQSRDMTLFQDTDGSGYLLFEDRERGLVVSRLSADYLNVAEEMSVLQRPMESPAILHVGNLYYVLGSGLTGWDTNPNFYATSPSLRGPWSEFKQIAPDSPNTFNSQTTFLLPVKGDQGTSYIYLGDRWKKEALWDSRYVWIPIVINGPTMTLAPNEPWTLDVKSGKTGKLSWTPPLPEGDYQISEAGSGRVLTVQGSTERLGATLGGGNQTTGLIWHLTPSHGFYSIEVKPSSQVMEVVSESNEVGAAVGLWTQNGGLHQQWRLIPSKGGLFKIVNANSDLQLTLRQSSLGDDWSAVQVASTDSASSLWKIEPILKR
jgi:hypothetical protein